MVYHFIYLYCIVLMTWQEQQEGKRKMSLMTSPWLVMATSMCSKKSWRHSVLCPANWPWQLSVCWHTPTFIIWISTGLTSSSSSSPSPVDTPASGPLSSRCISTPSSCSSQPGAGWKSPGSDRPAGSCDVPYQPRPPCSGWDGARLGGRSWCCWWCGEDIGEGRHTSLSRPDTSSPPHLHWSHTRGLSEWERVPAGRSSAWLRVIRPLAAAVCLDNEMTLHHHQASDSGQDGFPPIPPSHLEISW